MFERPVCWLSSCAWVLLALLSISEPVCAQQSVSTIVAAITPSPASIAHVPPLAHAILADDKKLFYSALDKEDVNERLPGKDGERAGYTPVILAAAVGDAAIVKELVNRGAKINILDDFNRSAIWYAAFRGNAGSTAVLLEGSGAKEVINTADKDSQRTPLHMAVRSGAPGVVPLLLRSGASTQLRDDLDETPGDYCKRRITLTLACKEMPLK